MKYIEDKTLLSMIHGVYVMSSTVKKDTKMLMLASNDN